VKTGREMSVSFGSLKNMLATVRREMRERRGQRLENGEAGKLLFQQVEAKG
jgi:hypothetical protein